jgi:predicted Zn finger-like uncharacterized protein
MPVDRVTCPKCQTVLRPTKPLLPGKAVKCPKCGASFTAPMDNEEVLDVIALQPEPASKPAPAANPTLPDDDDGGPATYRFVDELEVAPKKPARRSRYDDDDEDEDDEDRKEGADEKSDISIVPDLTVKDPRGIAQEIVIRPSNWLMLVSVIDIVLTLVMMGFFLIPIFFSLPPDTERGPLVNMGVPSTAKDKDAAKRGGLSWETGTGQIASWIVVLMVLLIGGFLLAYNGVIVSGCVRMQNLESYGWCIAACIMAMIPISTACYLFRLLLGVACLITLRRADVIDGFNYRAE